MFGENLFDVPENQVSYRQLLGLEEHTPFECVGQVEESRLAFALCSRKGLDGQAMEAFRKEVLPGWSPDGVEALYDVDQPHRIPAPIAERLIPLLARRAADALAAVETILDGSEL